MASILVHYKLAAIAVVIMSLKNLLGILKPNHFRLDGFEYHCVYNRRSKAWLYHCIDQISGVVNNVMKCLSEARIKREGTHGQTYFLENIRHRTKIAVTW